jgi:nicotinamidase/pyrazinamidase
MTTRALVIVDVQNDFCRGGALPVPDATAILPEVNRLAEDFPHVFLTQDWHPPGHVSFASAHPGRRPFDRVMLPDPPGGERILWPDHCIAGTPGAAFHPGLHVPAAACIVRKGMRRDIDGYSAFADGSSAFAHSSSAFADSSSAHAAADAAIAAGLDALLRAAGVRAVTVVGLAADYCVMHTALDARHLGYEVTVIEAACRGIDADGSLAAAWRRLATAGVRRA